MKINLFTDNKLIGGVLTAINVLKEELPKHNIEVTNNKYDILHVHSVGPFALFKIIREKKPIIITAHMAPQQFSLLFPGRFLQKLIDKYIVYIYNKADLVLCPSEFAKNNLKKYGVIKEIEVLSNGVNTTKFTRSEIKRNHSRKNYKNDDIIIGCIGNPSKGKGLDTFIKVAKQNPNYKFVWVGANVFGVLNRDYRYIKNLEKIPNFEMVGYKNTSDFLSGLDILLFPSLLETEGIVILETMCSEVPIITNRIPGLDWVIENEHVLKASSVDEYTEKISQIIKNPQKTTKMVLNAKLLSSSKDTSEIIPKLVYIYKEVNKWMK